jgi:hypothetical protein
MRWRSCIYPVILVFVSVAACGGLSAEPESRNADAELGAGGSGSTRPANAGQGGRPPTALPVGVPQTNVDQPPAVAVRVPEKHRPRSAQCDRVRPPGNARPYEPGVPCPEDGGGCQVPDGCSDCRVACVDYADGSGPQCVVGRGECLSDADCTANDNGRCWDNRGNWYCTYDTCYSDASCTSGGPCACEGESGSAGNTCLPGNCQTDADCGSNGYCGPSFGGCGGYSGVIAYYCHTPADTCVDDSDCSNPAQGAGYCMYTPEVGRWSCGYGQCVG